jgi:hypothetical protein
MDGYFGFSEKGCQWCKCDENGSEGPDCNEVTGMYLFKCKLRTSNFIYCLSTSGQCKCKPFVIGRDCSHCEPGYWNIATGKGCEPCDCKFLSINLIVFLKKSEYLNEFYL